MGAGAGSSHMVFVIIAACVRDSQRPSGDRSVEERAPGSVAANAMSGTRLVAVCSDSGAGAAACGDGAVLASPGVAATSP